jgi:hypothetical protein
VPTVPRTVIGAVFFLLGSTLCSVLGNADLCQILRHVGYDILVADPAPSNGSQVKGGGQPSVTK